MPSVTLHLVLADRVLERWMDAPREAPFRPDHPFAINAFYQGAFGPDLGYFPGGYRLLSELSHLVASGDLTRLLVDRARTETERAFAWGWVSHVLADVSIHPLVGRAVGEYLYGDRTLFADGAGHQAAHVQVETGLDAFYSRLFPDLRKRKVAPVFDGNSVRFLADAFRDLYSLPLDRSVVLSSHLATTRMAAQGLMTIGTLSTALLACPVSRSFSGTRWFFQGALALMKLGLKRDSLLKAFLNPVPPTEWFVREVGHQVDAFPDLFFHHVDTNLEEMENFNLDTGRIQGSPPTHRGTLETQEVLARMGGRIPSEPGIPLPVGGLPQPPRIGAYG